MFTNQEVVLVHVNWRAHVYYLVNEKNFTSNKNAIPHVFAMQAYGMGGSPGELSEEFVT